MFAMNTSSTNLVVEPALPGALLIRLSGNYRGQGDSLSVTAIREVLGQSPEVKSLTFDSAGLTGWDSRFVASLHNCAESCRAHNIEFQDDGLPAGVRRLLQLALAVPERKDAHHLVASVPFLQSIGERALQARESAL